MRLNHYLDTGGQRSRYYLEKVQRRVGERSRYYLAKIQGRPIVNFLHVGKTGGSAVKDALSQVQRPNKVLFRLHPHRVRLSDIPEGEKFFFFLREPIRRFVSGFNSRQRQGRPRYYNPWSPAERIAFSRFRSPDELAVSLSSADQHVRNAAEDAMRAIGHVRYSYDYWFISEEYFRSRLSDLILIGFQESLEVDFDRLKNIIGLQKDLALPGNDGAAHRGPSTQEVTLSAEAKANLARWYAMDLQFYSLCQQIAATHFHGTSGVEDTPARSGAT
jgi:hypothetical protein